MTAFLLALLAGGAYLAWSWGPVYVVHYEVKQVVRDYMNQAINEPNDDQLMRDMLHKLRVLDQLDMPDENGRVVAVPTVQLAPDDVTWQRDTARDPPTLRIAFEYTRPVRYPLLDRWTETTLSIDFTEDLRRPDWGPAR
jgi:hypothetical protein